MLKFDRNSIFVYSVFAMTVGVLLGIFTTTTHIPTFWPSVIVILFLTILHKPYILIRRSVVVSILLFFVVLTFSWSGHFNGLPDVVLKPFGIFTIVYPYVLVAILIENLIDLSQKDDSIKTKIGKFGFQVLIFALVYTFISEIFYSGITRGLIKSTLPFWAWSVSFGTIYAMPFVLMAVIMFGHFKRIYLIGFFLLFFITILRSGFMIALVITSLGVLISIFYRLNVRKIYFNLAIVLAITLFVIYSLDMVLSFLPQLPNEIYAEKANDIAKIQGSGDISGVLNATRQGVYELSVETILKFPIFGSGVFTDSGQHSYILDRIAFVGIIGFSFYFLVLYTLYKRALLLIDKSDRKGYQYIIIALFLLLFVNPVEWPDFWIVIFVLIPSVIAFLRKESSLFKNG